MRQQTCICKVLFLDSSRANFATLMAFSTLRVGWSFMTWAAFLAMASAPHHPLTCWEWADMVLMQVLSDRDEVIANVTQALDGKEMIF